MDTGERTAAKALVFGLAMPLITLPLSRHMPGWVAWGVAAPLSCMLFHWLPPRLHSMTVLRSVAISLLSGVCAAGAVLLVERLF